MNVDQAVKLREQSYERLRKARIEYYERPCDAAEKEYTAAQKEYEAVKIVTFPALYGSPRKLGDLTRVKPPR